MGKDRYVEKGEGKLCGRGRMGRIGEDRCVGRGEGRYMYVGVDRCVEGEEDSLMPSPYALLDKKRSGELKLNFWLGGPTQPMRLGDHYHVALKAVKFACLLECLNIF